MRKAFLVGINTYPGAPLSGCINDVNLMKGVLTRFRFDSIVTCLDKQATRVNILSGLKALVANAKAGDYLLFHYSGHGSQVPDVNRDEADRMDEIICPIDINFQRNVFITDDEIGAIIGSVPANVTVEVILDCCHSGTGLRDFNPFTKNRYLPPPENYLETMTHFRELVIVPDATKTNAILWGACRSTETAADARISNTYNGAFTYSLVQTLNAYPTPLPRKQVEQKISELMKSRGWPQHAQLECKANQQGIPFLSMDNSKEVVYVEPKKSLWQKVVNMFFTL